MNPLNIVWWAGYVVVSLCLQRLVPGCDALAPGFLIALQEKRISQVVWLFVLFTLIQEGAGSLRFGMSMLWYGGLIFLFHMSARLFVADNLLFVALLSVAAGVYQGFLLWLMTALQDYPLSFTYIAEKAALQAVFIPCAWGLAYLLRPKGLRHAH